MEDYTQDAELNATVMWYADEKYDAIVLMASSFSSAYCMTWTGRKAHLFMTGDFLVGGHRVTRLPTDELPSESDAAIVTKVTKVVTDTMTKTDRMPTEPTIRFRLQAVRGRRGPPALRKTQKTRML